MTTSNTRLVTLASSAILLAACTGSPNEAPTGLHPRPPSAAESPVVVTDLASFTDALESAGQTVRVGGRTGLEDVFGVRGRAVRFSGTLVMAFDYPTEKDFEALRSSVNKRGDMVGPAIIDWLNPHLYGAGTLIVVYLGKNSAAIGTLEELLGPQFSPR